MSLINKKVLVKDGYTDWRIVIGDDASPSEKHACKELQYFIKEISGVNIPIVEDRCEMRKKEIIIGNNNHLVQLELDIDWSKLGDEGFVIKTLGDFLIIAGGKLRGTIYGVYTFLEDYLGCRWFSSKVSFIPKRKVIEIPDIDVMQVPVLEYREPYYFDAFDGDWAVRNKCNSNFARLEERHGKKLKYSTYFVHTFDKLVPVSEYFDTHPEYFSEINGKRISERTQLCLTNEDVFKIALNKIREWIEKEPEATIFSVSQNDWYNPCQCKRCREIDEREGSHSGTLLYFVNRIAEEIEKDYPDKFIDTLAYQYTRKPPKYIRPRKNVIIRLCSIECCFSHPLEKCNAVSQRFENRVEKGSSFAADLREWAKITDRLYVWDYVTNFAHYIMPFPNLYVLKPNIQFMIKNNVKGIFAEGNYAKGGKGEFAELRAYLLAKLLWNPDYDVDRAINEFLVGYYGNSAVPIREYIDILHKKVVDENIHVGIYDPPTSKYLSEDIIRKAEELFDKAEILADNEEILERIRIARLPIEYVKLSTMPLNYPHREELIEEFFAKLEKVGITQIREGKTLEESKRMMIEGRINTF